ncbi:MAG: bifunctional 4-hydroxy-2-oxoglutarate aldolase/2-dehydro-3-deoxy-phosphogluconate aldolase [Victivallales bacterium]|nr:bifunctional 4-hydroxy-2-oxoglutarate aldolase/2-dehydro-3-deoxy-phosphogluconate aldolase [Victivallales bacterium]
MSDMILDELRSYGVVPVVAVPSVDAGLRLCEALLRGGLPVAEVTFRTDAAAATIAAARERFPEMILGAGTVLTPEQVQRSVDSGARFAVAPGCNPTIVTAAQEAGLVFAPGVCTPSDIERALELGCRFLKFFPAEAAGGVPMLKSLIAPYRHLGVGFCPTGGVKAANMLEYLGLPEVGFVGGTWVASGKLIEAGAWDEIAILARTAVALAAQR